MSFSSDKPSFTTSRPITWSKIGSQNVSCSIIRSWTGEYQSYGWIIYTRRVENVHRAETVEKEAKMGRGIQKNLNILSREPDLLDSNLRTWIVMFGSFRSRLNCTWMERGLYHKSVVSLETTNARYHAPRLNSFWAAGACWIQQTKRWGNGFGKSGKYTFAMTAFLMIISTWRWICKEVFIVQISQ